VLPLGEKAGKVAILGFALLMLLQNLGLNITGLLAGLGVGGLAVALAAQKTVENLFGGISLILDQPVRVGDYCRYGDKTGTVEDIGLRSTRVRSLDRTIVSIPNAEFAYLQLENFARRDKIRFTTRLRLRYDTTPDQLRYVLAEVRKLLLSHPRIESDPARVRFVECNEWSLDLEVFAFVTTTDGNEELAVREDLLLRLMDIVAAAGTGFALPTSTVRLGRDRGNDAELTRAAEESVQSWREKNELPFPDFSPEVQQALDDSLDYPPRGSVLAARE
jgi:MscS family membrane protein